MPRLRTFALTLLLAAACSPDFDPASHVEKLRVLAVRAEPPEIAPVSDGSAPPRAVLRTLVAHPEFLTDQARRAVVLHLACTPVPGDPAASPCALISELATPDALLGAADLSGACTAPGRGSAGALTFAGLESCGLTGCGPLSVRTDPENPASVVELPAPAYELPAEGFDLAAPWVGAAERVLGTEVTDVALALDASQDDLAPRTAVPDACSVLASVASRFEELWTVREHVTALKRIRVRGPDAESAAGGNPNPPNQNPSISGISLAGSPLPPPGDAPPSISSQVAVDLLPLLPTSAVHEEYVKYDAAGAMIETATEDWSFSWFATAGDLDGLHTRDAAEPEAFTAPASGRVVVYSVVRDLRGGIAWTSGMAEVMP